MKLGPVVHGDRLDWPRLFPTYTTILRIPEDAMPGQTIQLVLEATMASI